MEEGILRVYALRARKVLIEQITKRAISLGANRVTTKLDKTRGLTPDVEGTKKNTPLDILCRDIAKRGLEQVVEDVACLWFNRIICIRYMEVNGFLGPEAAIKWDDADNRHYKRTINEQCKKLVNVSPAMFKNCLGYEGLLLPEDIDKGEGIVRDIINDIDRKYFIDNVQIIGWLYQYFISPKKDKIYKGLKNKKKIMKEDIPAATQFFTPDWIVKYMVENTLGRLWYEAHHDDGLRSRWRYYIDDNRIKTREREYAGAGDGVGLGAKGQLKRINPLYAKGMKNGLRPEDIKFIDPAMGSGHILVYAFDVLYDIYLSQGYKKDLIPRLIINKNLYGVDIDSRAAAIAHFALMMKGRTKDKAFFNKEIISKLRLFHESDDLSVKDIVYLIRKGGNNRPLPGAFIKDIGKLLEVFRNAREFGSITVIGDMDIEPLQVWWEDLSKELGRINNGSEGPYSVFKRVLRIIEQARIMLDSYHVVVTNPPYMGIRGMNSRLGDYLNAHYKHSKYDLFTVFMDVALKRTLKGGYFALINQHSWMFLSSYEKFREQFLKKCSIHSMLHLGTGVFGESVGTIVQSTAFIAKKAVTKGYPTIFMDLQDCGNAREKERAFLAEEASHIKVRRYVVPISELYNIPGKPVAYWADKSVIAAFVENKKLGDIAKPRQGMATSDNKRFIRYWYEVPHKSIGFRCKNADESIQSRCKWFPYNKGGPYRKWFGNNVMVVNWERDGKELKELASSLYGSYSRTIKNIKYYFKESITYTFISADLGVRYSPPGFIFDVAGSSIFAPGDELFVLLAFLCSKPSQMFLKLLNPTFNIQVGDIKNLPFPSIKDDALRDEIIKISRANVDISKECWDLEEISWDFKKHPLLRFREDAVTVKGAYSNWVRRIDTLTCNLKRNEEKLNDIFIKLFRLEGCLKPDVRDKDITIHRPDKAEAMKSFISYAVGCMFGRYSVGDGFSGNSTDVSVCEAFRAAMEDNIIPITGAGCSEESLLGMFISFVEGIFGKRTLALNIDFIAHCLGRRGHETNIETLRRYLEDSFYKDHLLRYNRRPIYWLLDSGGEKGFRGLVYLHNLKIANLRVIRKKYLRKTIELYRQKLRLSHNNNLRACIKRRLNECIIYDRVLLKAIKQNPNIDLDDGVVYNYQKFQGISTKDQKSGQTLKMDLFAKIRP